MLIYGYIYCLMCAWKCSAEHIFYRIICLCGSGDRLGEVIEWVNLFEINEGNTLTFMYKKLITAFGLRVKYIIEKQFTLCKLFLQKNWKLFFYINMGIFIYDVRNFSKTAMQTKSESVLNRTIAYFQTLNRGVHQTSDWLLIMNRIRNHPKF